MPYICISALNGKIVMNISILADSGFFFRLLVSKWCEVYNFWGISEGYKQN